jgi:hypothetical protein
LGAMVYLGIYERIHLLYFEENTADRYAMYGVIPVLICVLIYYFFDRYYHSIKDNRFIDAAKHALGGVISFGLLYYFILVPVFSGAIILTNDIFGSNEMVLVKGKVVNKLEAEGVKLSEYELTVQTNTETTTWDTNRIETKRYQIGDDFNMEMKKGFWGLLSKEK